MPYIPRFKNPPELPVGGTYNLGLSVTGNELSILGADGTALSSSNPAYVCVPGVTAGRNKVLPITASTVVNIETAFPVMLCGITTAVAWANDTPWFLYMANEDDTATNSGFFISRNPCMTVTPAAGQIHDLTALAATDTQTSIAGFWADDAGKAAKPCVCLGSFRMTYDITGTDHWVITALGNSDGIGKFNDATSFTFPVGQNGNQALHYTGANGPIWGIEIATYTLSRDGQVSYYFNSSGVCTNGGDANLTLFYLPIAIVTAGSYYIGNNACFYGALATSRNSMWGNATTWIACTRADGGGQLLNNGWSNAGDFGYFNLTYKAF